MGADRIFDLRGAVVDMLNTGVAPFDNNGNDDVILFQAEEGYGRAYANEDLKDVRVYVRFLTVEQDTGDRTPSNDERTVIEITVQQLVNLGDGDAVDTLVILGRRIARHFAVSLPIDSEEVPESDGVQVVECNHVIYDPEQLAKGKFHSTILVTLQELGAA